MATDLLPDPATPFGQRVRRRLAAEILAWLTTVGGDGTPQPNPIWFLWDGQTFLIYNRPGARRLNHVRRRPRVALNLDGDSRGGDIVVVTGEAELIDGAPPPHQVPAYLAKYSEHMLRVSGSLERFGEQYPVAMRVRPLAVRGH